MICAVAHIFLGLSFVLFPCRGQIGLPPGGASLTFLQGSNDRIAWTFKDPISKVDSRVWHFTSSDGSIKGERLARIIDDGDLEIDPYSGLSGVSIIKPATLVLKNVNQTYNGTYRFTLSSPAGGYSEVAVFIAITPKIYVNCASRITLNQNDDFACECEGLDGNPPADVTWFKENTVRSSGKEKTILHLFNITREDNGTYRCEAKSHENAKNATTIEFIVNYAPGRTVLNYDDVSLTITCDADGSPSPSFKIYLNESVVVNSRTYKIPNRNSSYLGNYKCEAVNPLGRKFSSTKLLPNLGEPTPSPAPTSKSTDTSGDDGDDKKSSGGLGVGAIVGIVIGALVLVVVAVVGVWCYKSKQSCH